MKQKKIPERHCLGCGNGFPQNELIRVVRLTDGKVCIDKSYKMQGRGAYICKNSKCLNKTIKSNRLKKSLEADIENELIDELENIVNGTVI